VSGHVEGAGEKLRSEVDFKDQTGPVVFGMRGIIRYFPTVWVARFGDNRQICAWFPDDDRELSLNWVVMDAKTLNAAQGPDEACNASLDIFPNRGADFEFLSSSSPVLA